MKCLWMLSHGSSFGVKGMESLMILSDGLLSFWSISVVLLLKMKRTGLMIYATGSTSTWLVQQEIVIIWAVASHCQMCWDIAETRHCSPTVEAWTFLNCLTRCEDKIQSSTTCLDQILLPCYCVIPNKDSLSRSTCSGHGIHIAPAATYPFDIRLGAFQGHSNQVVDPIVAHHQLTYDEAMSLGWIFHVTDYRNLESI